MGPNEGECGNCGNELTKGEIARNKCYCDECADEFREIEDMNAEDIPDQPTVRDIYPKE